VRKDKVDKLLFLFKGTVKKIVLIRIDNILAIISFEKRVS